MLLVQARTLAQVGGDGLFGDADDVRCGPPPLLRNPLDQDGQIRTAYEVRVGGSRPPHQARSHPASDLDEDHLLVEPLRGRGEHQRAGVRLDELLDNDCQSLRRPVVLVAGEAFGHRGNRGVGADDIPGDAGGRCWRSSPYRGGSHHRGTHIDRRRTAVPPGQLPDVFQEAVTARAKNVQSLTGGTS